MQDELTQNAIAAPQGLTETDVIVVGGGPGGLAVSQQLGERGIAHVVLERGAHPGWMWGHTYDSLRLHTGRHLSALPGMPYPNGTALFPSRAEFLRYLTSYVERFRIPLQVGVEARALERVGSNWRVKTDAGWIAAQAIVVATGIMSAPVLPRVSRVSQCIRVDSSIVLSTGGRRRMPSNAFWSSASEIPGRKSQPSLPKRAPAYRCQCGRELTMSREVLREYQASTWAGQSPGCPRACSNAWRGSSELLARPPGAGLQSRASKGLGSVPTCPSSA